MEQTETRNEECDTAAVHGTEEVNSSNGVHESNGHHGHNGHNGHNGVRGFADLYELLQISPFAGSETIHRIYRFLAARYHPDNPETGNADMFHQVKTAHDVLSNPERRAKYDAARSGDIEAASPMSSAIDFMDDIEGELNRRLGLLAVLYARRRTSPRHPEVSLMEIETYMGFPRDYLDFTTWYLVKKGFVHQADNSDFTLTVAGVDYVESQRTHVPILNRLLTSGQIRTNVPAADRRINLAERRMNLPDERPIKTERRAHRFDRRINRLEVREKFGLSDIN
ncbi:MAG TPA: J domain-containing protein [Terracidiphilus sp.]|nr:J domain-containing protein [Terracidiphilus sp.]